MPRTKLRTPQTLDHAGDDFVLGLARELSSSLAALRAALEGVACELGHGDPRLERVLRAVEQTFPIARQAQALADCASQHPAQLQSCTPAEILCALRRALPVAQQGRLVLALEDVHTRFRADGPLLVRALTLFCDRLLHSGADKLLVSVRRTHESLRFGLTWGGRTDAPGLALPREFLRRAAQRTGAALCEGLSPTGCARVELCFVALRERGAGA